MELQALLLPFRIPPETHPQVQLQTKSLAENEAKGIRQFTFSVVSLRALLSSPTLQSSDKDSFPPTHTLRWSHTKVTVPEPY